MPLRARSGCVDPFLCTVTTSGQPLAPLGGDVAALAWTLKADDVTAEITTAFEADGVESVLLKGYSLSRLLYAGDGERRYRDTDLLVRSDARDRAEGLLRELGFVRVDRDADWLGPEPQYAHTFRRMRDGALVDLHWRLSGATAAPARQWTSISARTHQVEIGGCSIAVLDAATSAMLVALHTAHHGTGFPRALTDLDRAVEQFELTVWVQAAELARDLGASEPFAAGLRLIPAGDALADRMRLVRPASVEMWLKTNPRGHGAWVIDRFAQTRSVRGRLWLCLRVLVPAPAVMRTSFPLARRGRAGLALTYALRPVRLAVHAAPALREWARASRATRAVAPRWR